MKSRKRISSEYSQMIKQRCKISNISPENPLSLPLIYLGFSSHPFIRIQIIFAIITQMPADHFFRLFSNSRFVSTFPLPSINLCETLCFSSHIQLINFKRSAKMQTKSRFMKNTRFNCGSKCCEE